MVKIELRDRLKLIKHQMKIFQVYDENSVLDQALGRKVHSFKEPRIQVQNDKQLTKISKLKNQ